MFELDTLFEFVLRTFKGVTIWLVIGLSLDASAAEYTGTVVGVTDGDTLKVMHDGVVTKTRLAEIDCPEKTQAFGVQATKFTTDIILGKDVRVVEVDTDRYGRTVALTFIPDGKCLNEELVRKGYAWCYTKYCKDARIFQMEQQARDQHVGLWDEAAPVEPAKFRLAQRGRHKLHRCAK